MSLLSTTRLSCHGRFSSGTPLLFSSIRLSSSKPNVTILHTSNQSSPKYEAPQRVGEKAHLIYTGPLNGAIQGARMFSVVAAVGCVACLPLTWGFLVVDKVTMASIFGGVAAMPMLAVACISPGYVNRMWIPKDAKEQTLMFETETLFGTARHRVIPVSQLRYRQWGIWGTWRSVDDPWYKPGFAVDFLEIKKDFVLNRIYEQVNEQSKKQ
ncbi:hypothetical protein HDU79_003216 [Rhizoclosmatium sp. JEL0117]|nr:hypothetical protein HDU79_003216 [Rhizoclosmatium sp. JEL0117]